mgnify:CR=1 FL=1|jgi:hypothetical protein|tara:strand:+ start:220 stop:648 length:429 start_codon:yes stop_codon:yes gene_type:complete
MQFEQFGVTFEYPDNWSIDVDSDDVGGSSATVQSPDGGFWNISVYPSGTNSKEMVQVVSSEMQKEYQDIDIEVVHDTISGIQLSGLDFNFYCLDLTNTAHVRAVENREATYIIFCQAEDREWESIHAVFEAMTASFLRSLTR